MAQTGFTPILLYASSTASQAPLAANLTNSTGGSELAINITDGKLYYKDNAGAVQVIGWKTVPATAGGTGQTSYAVGDLLYANTTTSLAKLADVATGNALISGGVGVAPSWGKVGLTTHVSGTLPTANGGTNLTSFTANGLVFASSTSALSTSSVLAYDGTYFLINSASTGNGKTACKNNVYCYAAESSTANTSDVYYINFISSTGTQNGYIYRPTSTGTTQLVSSSDQRLKKNIVDAAFDGLDVINAVKVREFDWEETGSHSIGFIAQELQQVCSDAVAIGEDDENGNIKRPWAVSREALVPYLVKAIQELAGKIASLENNK